MEGEQGSQDLLHFEFTLTWNSWSLWTINFNCPENHKGKLDIVNLIHFKQRKGGTNRLQMNSIQMAQY